VDNFCSGCMPSSQLDEPASASCVSLQACCGVGANLVVNGDFEADASGFISELRHQAGPYVANAVMPGEYAVLDGTQASQVAPVTWIAANHSSCPSAGKFLAVNGETGKTGSRVVVWKQTILVTPGTEYRFCAYFRNLRACALDGRPKVMIRFSSLPNVMEPVAFLIDRSPTDACDWVLESRNIVIPCDTDSSLTVEILLDESTESDGNDLAIDDISLRASGGGS
jgi:hypothetical protein